MARLFAAAAVWLAVLGLAERGRAVEVLTADDVLIVEFETTPPFLCGTVPCTPDTALLQLGPVEIPERFLEQTARLYVDDVRLGTWLSTAYGLVTGTVGSLLGGAWKDASSSFTVGDPQVIDFQPLLDGTVMGRMEVRIAAGSIEIDDGFPFVRIILIEATSEAGGYSSTNNPTITSVRIETDPETGIFAVDSSAGSPDADPGDGFCATSTEECTLPAAVDEANALPGGNAITIPAGTYPGALTITGDVSIQGAGAGTTVIDAAGSGTVLTITAGSVWLEGVTITGGDTAGSGGGIALQGGELDLSQSEVSGNNADADGGGIHQSGDTLLFLLLSTVRQNTAGGSGGGIYSSTSFGDLDILASEISDNVALLGDGGGVRAEGLGFVILDGVSVRGNTANRGGGITATGEFVWIADAYVFENTAAEGAGGVALHSPDAFLEDSTLSDNQSASGAGGLLVFEGGTVGVFNVTFSGNQGLAGGGIALESPFTVELANATVTRNGADQGGGLRLASSSGVGSLQLRNSVVAANTAVAAGPDCLVSGGLVSLVSQGHNLVGDGSDCGFPTSTGDLVGSAGSRIAPLLAPLAATGGPTPTHAPLIGSPLVDAGSPDEPGTTIGSCELFDQRGELRPLDGDGDGSKICDIGAHERSLAAVPAAGAAGIVTLALLLSGAGYTLSRRLAA